MENVVCSLLPGSICCSPKALANYCITTECHSRRAIVPDNRAKPGSGIESELEVEAAG